MSVVRHARTCRRDRDRTATRIWRTFRCTQRGGCRRHREVRNRCRDGGADQQAENLGEPLPMNGAVRQRKIREMLEAEEFLDMERLKTALDASESTIRRDLAGLEGEGILKRVY